MGYSGAKLQHWFDDTRVIPRGCLAMADHMGAHTTRLVKQNTPIDTGELRAEIHQKPVRARRGLVAEGFAAGDRVYESGAESELEYAPYVEHGTGLWGPKHAKYLIVPKRPDGWLRWIDPTTGQPVFAKRVMHPGSPGNHMFEIGAAIAEFRVRAAGRADPLADHARARAHDLPAPDDEPAEGGMTDALHCEQCGRARKSERIETVATKRNQQGWKCRVCGWWNWL